MIAIKRSWFRRAEHGVLRGVSLGFSMASAYAIRLFFAPLDSVDRLEGVITWMIALGFGVLGYFVSRGLVHRMMNKEPIRVYVPICFVVELVDIACNYTLAAEVVHRASWLTSVPLGQRALLTAITYVVLSVIPLVSILLAVVDMDLERSKTGVTATQGTPAQPMVLRGTNPNATTGKGQPPVVRVPDTTQRTPASTTMGQEQAKRAGQWQGINARREREQETMMGQGQRRPEPMTQSQRDMALVATTQREPVVTRTVPRGAVKLADIPLAEG